MSVNDFVGRMKKREKARQDFRESLSYSTDYIDWLEQFTASHGSFSTETFSFDGELLTPEDKFNIGCLEALFEEIYDYAEDNYIPLKESNFGAFYSIQHNGVGYSIGVDYGQGCQFYCERLVEPDSDALEYKHIMSSVKLPKTLCWDSQLDVLVELMERLGDEIPVDAIEKVTNKTLIKMKRKKKEK